MYLVINSFKVLIGLQKMCRLATLLSLTIIKDERLFSVAFCPSTAFHLFLLMVMMCALKIEILKVGRQT